MEARESFIDLEQYKLLSCRRHLIGNNPVRDTHPLVMLAEDTVADAVPRLLGIDDRELEAVEELD